MGMTLFAVYAPPVTAAPLHVSKAKKYVCDTKVEAVHSTPDKQDPANQYRVYGKMSLWNSSDITGQHIDLRI